MKSLLAGGDGMLTYDELTLCRFDLKVTGEEPLKKQTSVTS